MSATSNVIAIMTCPHCDEQLNIDETPHTDWKHGTVRLKLQLTQDACEHLADCLGFLSTELPAEPEGIKAGDESNDPGKGDETIIAEGNLKNADGAEGQGKDPASADNAKDSEKSTEKATGTKKAATSKAKSSK